MKTGLPNLGWQANRIRWNRKGLCARKACVFQHDFRQHPVTSLLYCDSCAGRIEAAQGIVLHHGRTEQDDG